MDSVTVHVAYPLAANLPDAVRTITASLAAAAGHERFEVSVSVPTELVKFEPQILVLLLGAADGMEAALDPGSPETLLVAVGSDGEPNLPSGFSLEQLKAVVLHREANEDLPEGIADPEMAAWQQKLEAQLQPPFLRGDVQFERTSGHSGDRPWHALLDRDDEPGWEM